MLRLHSNPRPARETHPGRSAVEWRRVAKLENTFSWSLSRRRTFERCKRAYWFSYYGGWGGWEPGASPRARRIWLLKKLTTRAQWTGTVVHDVIARALRKLREGQPPLDPEEVVEQTLHRMRADYKDSLENRFLLDPKRYVRFLEHEYGVSVRRERWKESADRAQHGLRNFFASEIHAQLRALAREDWLEIEDSREPPPFVQVDEVPVHVRVDLAFRDGKAVTVVDWKTGRGTEPEGRDQLAGYALYAQDRWGAPAAMVRAREVNVVQARETLHRLDGGFLDEFRVRLRRSVKEMRSFLKDPAANRALPEDSFPYTADEKECRYCPFVGACPRWEGQAATPWDGA